MIDWSTVIVGLLSLLGTILGSFGGMKLMTYRIEQLEKRVDKHNHVIERTYDLEQCGAVVKEQIKVINNRIKDLESEVKHEHE